MSKSSSTIVAGFLICSTVAACASQAQSHYSPPSHTVSVKDDQFEKSITLVGFPEQHEARYLGVDGTNRFFLRSWINKQTGAVQHQIYVSHTFNGGWIYWNSARDQDADALEFVSISRDVVDCSGGCTETEIFGLTVLDAKLKKFAATGYSVKVSSRTGREKILNITSEQIQKQLAAVETKRLASLH